MYDEYDDEDLSFLHDEDSDRPNSIQDEEPELDDEEQYVQDIIQDTISDLEDAAEEKGEKVALDKGTVQKALQLLKAYSCLYELTYEDYDYKY